MDNLYIFDHPIINDKIAQLRCKNTSCGDFRLAVNDIMTLMTFKITENLKTKEVIIETPLTKCNQSVLDEQIIIVPILRAGLGMVDGLIRILSKAKITHIGIERDETNLQPREYYFKVPNNISESVNIIVDPMLATGGSASFAVHKLKKEGAVKIIFVGLIGCNQGIKRLQADHPDIEIYLATCDEVLNEQGYIIPGLGDAGDRLFDTINE